MELAELVDLISNLGMTGVLIAALYLGFKGEIVPRPVIEEMKKHTETQTKLLATTLSKEISDGTEKAIEAGVAKGVVAAIDHINGKRSGA